MSDMADDFNDGRFYAEGLTLRKAPVVTKTERGFKASIGFPVCTLSEYVDETFTAEMAVCLNAHDALLKAITDAQTVLAEYIVPDSGISDTECVNRLLGILDHQDLVRVVRSVGVAS